MSSIETMIAEYLQELTEYEEYNNNGTCHKCREIRNELITLLGEHNNEPKKTRERVSGDV